MAHPVGGALYQGFAFVGGVLPWSHPCGRNIVLWPHPCGWNADFLCHRDALSLTQLQVHTHMFKAGLTPFKRRNHGDPGGSTAVRLLQEIVCTMRYAKLVLTFLLFCPCIEGEPQGKLAHSVIHRVTRELWHHLPSEGTTFV